MTLTTWEWLTVFGTVIGALIPFLLGMGRLVLLQLEKRLDQRFATLATVQEQFVTQAHVRFSALEQTTQTHDQRLTQLLIDLPNYYWRREDAIRQDTHIIHRLDAIAQQVAALSQCEVRACPWRESQVRRNES